jgi:hypothetical protein
MTTRSMTTWMLGNEARALLTRLSQVRSFALGESMVPAANLPPEAQVAIERQLTMGRNELRKRVSEFQVWLNNPEGQKAPPAKMQRRFTFIRLRFNAVLSQFDLFSDVITQRSEHETGVWLSGLDVAASDALRLNGTYFSMPPIVCYLDRGAGAAIRRVRTRLPGGGENPVAIVRVPRERMIGSAIASSLVHEVGHQGAALLNLVASMRLALNARQQQPGDTEIWRLYERWISEILADFWSVAHVGVCATLGLMNVVSLPRIFVLRLNPEDPHPAPWIRVLISCAIGDALYPHPQWQRLARLWEAYYPLDGLEPKQRGFFERLRQSVKEFAALLVNHKPASLRGRTLAQAMPVAARQPERLAANWRAWCKNPAAVRKSSPTLVFATLGQAKADRQITPEQEAALLSRQLTGWALNASLNRTAACAERGERSRALFSIH